MPKPLLALFLAGVALGSCATAEHMAEREARRVWPECRQVKATGRTSDEVVVTVCGERRQCLVTLLECQCHY